MVIKDFPITVSGSVTRRDWVYSDSEVTTAQAVILKKETGLLWPVGWAEAMQQSDPEAIQAMMWLVVSQSGQQCQISDVSGSILGFLEAYNAAYQVENPPAPDGEADPTPGAVAPDSPETSPNTESATS